MWTVLLLITLFVGGGTWVGILQSRQSLRHRQRLKGWQDAAESCGLQILEATSTFVPRLKAQAGPVEVRIELFGGDKGRSTQIVVMAPGLPDLQSVSIDLETRRLLLALAAMGRIEMTVGEIQLVSDKDDLVPDALPLLLDVCGRFAHE